MTMNSRWVMDDNNDGFDQNIEEMLHVEVTVQYDVLKNQFVEVGVDEGDIQYDVNGIPIISYTIAREIRTLPWKQVRQKYARILHWISAAREAILSMPFRIVINPERGYTQWQSKVVYDVDNVADMVAYGDLLLRPEAVERLVALKKKKGWTI